MPMLYVVRIDEPLHNIEQEAPFRYKEDHPHGDSVRDMNQKLINAENRAIANKWPKYINVPPAWFEDGELSVATVSRSGSPEDWLLKELAPKHPNSRLTLLQSVVAYRPATHTKE